MPWIDPERVQVAARYFRSVADQADDLQSVIQRGLTLSELPPNLSLINCREIDEELDLLAAILGQRADQVAGFRIQLPFEGNPEQSQTSTLFESLLDSDGAKAAITGSLAIEILLENRSSLAETRWPDEEFITQERLLDVLADPASAPELSAAVMALLSRPEWMKLFQSGVPHMADPGDPITVAFLETWRERNQLLTILAEPAAAAVGSGSTVFSDQQLIELGLDPSQLEEVGLSTNFQDILTDAVNFQTFVHSPQRAKDFIRSLPVQGRDGIGLNMFAIETASLRELHLAAVSDLGTTDADKLEAAGLIVRLPESPDGYRNTQITAVHAEVARILDWRLNGAWAGDPNAPGHSGANWFFSGVVASASVGLIIRGDLDVYYVGLPRGVIQDVADGNQALLLDLLEGLGPWILGTGPPSPHLLKVATQFWDDAAEETDPKRRQELTLLGNAALAIQEQTVVDPYLQLKSLNGFKKLSTKLISFPGETLRDGPGWRSAETVMTEMGELVVQSADGTELMDPIRIGDPIPASTDPNNLVRDFDLCEVMTEPFCTTADQAELWPEMNDRMPSIGEVLKLVHTSPELFAAVASYPSIVPTKDDSPERLRR